MEGDLLVTAFAKKEKKKKSGSLAAYPTSQSRDYREYKYSASSFIVRSDIEEFLSTPGDVSPQKDSPSPAGSPPKSENNNNNSSSSSNSNNNNLKVGFSSQKKKKGNEKFLTLIEGLPFHNIEPIANNFGLYGLLTGPDDKENNDVYANVASAWTTSTYPIVRKIGTRMGDPICDRFYLQMYDNCILAAVADGCNWGAKPREAAVLATNAFISYLASHMDYFRNTRDIGIGLLKALMKAHNKILEPREDPSEAGTTTLIGGVLVPLLENDNANMTGSGDSFGGKNELWAFVCVSVGDSKAFVYSRKKNVFSDITKNNRMNLTDVTDCGGRLGPQIGTNPDLRNLALSTTLLEKGDIIVLASDGVHDNLDPQTLGLNPIDLGLPPDTKDWKFAEVNYGAAAQKVKEEFMLSMLKKIVCGRCKDSNSESSLTPSDITSALVKYALEITAVTRSFMEANPYAKQPHICQEYPGKMDHTTCVSFRVGRVPKNPFSCVQQVLDNPIATKEFLEYSSKAMEESRVLNLIAFWKETERWKQDVDTSSMTPTALLNAVSNLHWRYMFGVTTDLPELKFELSEAAKQTMVGHLRSSICTAQQEVGRVLESLYRDFQHSKWMRDEWWYAFQESKASVAGSNSGKSPASSPVSSTSSPSSPVLKGTDSAIWKSGSKTNVVVVAEGDNDSSDNEVKLTRGASWFGRRNPTSSG